MDRAQLVKRLERAPDDPWDIAVVGGGAVGLGAALDATARGHSCVVLEQHDFCKGTSSRSTKLIHGGVRYLEQGNISLVREALHERGLLIRQAPTLVRPLRFVTPCYSARERWYYWTGMKLYDALAGGLGIQSSTALSTAETVAAIPGLRGDAVRGGVAYFDAQFDDASLGVALAKKCLGLGGTPLNYMQATGLHKQGGKISGLAVVDKESGRTYDLQAKVVINAAGVFSDAVRQLDLPHAPSMVTVSQGIHLVVDQRFLGGEAAMMIPKTKDGRVLFAIPWLGRALLGTTDTPVATPQLEPRPLAAEVDYLLEHFGQYLDPAPQRHDVLSAFAGLRPLVRPQHESGSTAKISREHRVLTSAHGLVSVMGGKWTTFRKMSEDVVDVAEQVAGLPHVPSPTRRIKFEVGVHSDPAEPDRGPTQDEVIQAVRQEFARTVEDVLARRLRCLLLNAKGSILHAPRVADWMAAELGHTPTWAATQVQTYSELARGYVLD